MSKSRVENHASKKCFFSITGGGGGLSIMENSIKRMFFFIESFPKATIFYSLNVFVTLKIY